LIKWRVLLSEVRLLLPGPVKNQTLIKRKFPGSELLLENTKAHPTESDELLLLLK
jgi:hypothetical protein